MEKGEPMKNQVKRLAQVIKNEQGMALAVVLMVIVVFSILGVALLGVAAGNTKLATINRTNQASYYIAEAGVTQKLTEIQDHIKLTHSNVPRWGALRFFQDVDSTFHVQTTSPGTQAIPDSYGTFYTTYNSFSNVNGTQPEADVSVYEDPNSLTNNQFRTYTITSTGKIGDEQTTVSQTFKLFYDFPIPNSTVFSMSKNAPGIKLNGAKEIVGSVGTNAGSGAIKIDGDSGGPGITGAIYYAGPITAGQPVVVTNHEEYYSPQVASPGTVYLPPFPTFPTLTMASQMSSGNVGINNTGDLSITGASNTGTLDLTQDEALNSLKVTKDQILIINTGSTDKSLVVNNFDVAGSIVLSGTGKLKIYINSNLSLASTTVLNGKLDPTSGIDPNNGGSPDQLSIYYPGSSHSVTLSGRIYAGIYVNQADLNIANNSIFYGPILDGKGTSITYNGTTTYAVLIEAPMADFTMIGSSKIVAKLVISSYTSNGSGSNLSDPNFNNYEQSPLFPTIGLFEKSPLREIK